MLYSIAFTIDTENNFGKMFVWNNHYSTLRQNNVS